MSTYRAVKGIVMIKLLKHYFVNFGGHMVHIVYIHGVYIHAHASMRVYVCVCVCMYVYACVRTYVHAHVIVCRGGSRKLWGGGRVCVSKGDRGTKYRAGGGYGKGVSPLPM